MGGFSRHDTSVIDGRRITSRNSVLNADALPTLDNKIGDVYYVLETQGTILSLPPTLKRSGEYRWTGVEWKRFGKIPNEVITEKEHGAPAHDPLMSYYTGNLVYFDGAVFRCIADIPPKTFDGNDWKAVLLNTSISDTDGDTKIQVEETADEDKIRFDTTGTERVIIDNTGNVGINTNTPREKLEVNGHLKSSNFATVWRSNASGGTYTANALVIHNGFIYRNIKGTNTNTSPNNDATNWTSNLEPDSGWIDVTGGVGFQNDWVDFDNRRRVQYRKVGKLVQIRGLTKDGLVGASRNIFRLPVGFRPSIGDSGTGHIFTTWHSSTSINRVQVNQDGDVVAYTNISSPLSLDGIMFFVD